MWLVCRDNAGCGAASILQWIMLRQSCVAVLAGSAPSPPADAPMYGQGGLDPAASPGPAASPDDGFSFGSSIIDANSIMRPGECPLGTEAPFINVTFRIIGQNVSSDSTHARALLP